MMSSHSFVLRRRSFGRVALLAVTLLLASVTGRVAVRTQSAGTVPAAGDIIFNEYAADNDANGNDFIELLVVGNGLDLRGLRVSDNELIGGVLNNNESVIVFGNDAFLSNVPRGTLIAVWTIVTGVTTDTVVNPGTADWRMVLAPGTGVSLGVDGLGGSVNAGLANGGEALYAYLPGPDGTSAGTDNVYLDFVSFEADGGDAPAGLVDLNLPSLADNAYYTGSTAAGNDLVANWVRYDFPPVAPNVPSPGDQNPGQNLSSLRVPPLQPDLTVSLSDSPDPIVVGEALVYSIGVGVGSQAAAGIAVQFTLPSGVLFVSATGSHGFAGAAASGSVTFSGGSLAVGETATLLVTTVPMAVGTVTSGDAIADPSNLIVESNESNNTAAGVTTTVLAASNTAPQVSAIAAFSGVIGDPTNPAPVFTVSDAETPATGLTVTATATSNALVAPLSSITIGGTGTTRTLTVNPAGVGYASITVTVSDGNGLSAAAFVSYAASAASTTPATSRFHTGASDASTAIAIDPLNMLIANDEDQTIRLYSRLASGPALKTFDFTASLGLTDLSGGTPREVDIEASTLVGTRIYWLGSHGNSTDGALRPNRSRLFATDVSGSGVLTELTYAGRYDHLRTDLIAWDNSNGHGLGAGHYGLAASAAAGNEPDAGDGSGFNIEGLTIAPDGSTAYLAFRGPLVPVPGRTRALVVPVTNFGSLLAANGGVAGSAIFGAPIELSLGQRAIRSLERNGSNQYLIVAGPPGSSTGVAPTDFRLFTWTGNPADAPVLRAANLAALNTVGSFEGIVEVPAPLQASSSIQVIVDEGDTVWYGDGVASKNLPDRGFQKFRSDFVVLGAELPAESGPTFGTLPVPGDIIFNEYASDNNAVDNDFFELLVLGDGLDLRGLRVTDNEIVSGVLNNNESVFVFGNDDFLSNVPRGTLIAVWTLATGVATDTVVNPAAGDWRLVLAPGTGVTASVDGLGGTLNLGLSTGGEALYVYLPGPDGSSAGTDNIYLDFMSFEADAGDPPAGFTDINLPSVSDNAYYTGNTAAGNNLAANWIAYGALNASTSPGDPNVGQDLSALRIVPNVAGVTVLQSGGSTQVAEGGSTDTYTIGLNTAPAGAVTIQVTADSQIEISANGSIFAQTLTIALTSTSSVTITVRAIDDGAIEGSTTSTIAHAIASSGDPAYSNSLTPIPPVTVAVTDNDVAVIAIRTIQGSGSASPLTGSRVTTRGIVTALKSNGFFIQEPDATIDVLFATSEGIQVFTGSAPIGVTRGDEVIVTGTVSEFVPAADPFQAPITELVSPTVAVLTSGNPLPAPIPITQAMTTAPNAVELLEQLEGMRVSIPSLTVVGPTLAASSSEPNATSTTSGVFYAVVTGVARPFREAGIVVPDPLPAASPCCVPRFDGNPERLRIDSDGQDGVPSLDLRSGVIVTGTTGPLDFGFRTYTVLPDAGSATVSGPNGVFTPVAAVSAGEITVAGFNLERFFDTTNDPGTGEPVLTAIAFQNRLNKASLAFRQVLRLPDIAGVSEVENLTTLEALAARINADAVAAGLPDPGYAAYLVEGNDPGGIDVGFLVRSSRLTVLGVRQEGKDATYSSPSSPGPETLNDRPPLVLEARAIRPDGSAFDFTVIINHLRSLLGVDDAVDGPRVRAKRRAQAEYLAMLIQGLQQGGRRVLAIGDFNAFEVSDGYVDVIGTIRGIPTPPDQVVLASPDLVSPNLVSLLDRLSADQRYSYVFDGSAQVLDHALVTSSLAPWISRFTYARSNTDFPDTTRNDPNRPERLSDHDASLTYVAIGVPRLTARVAATSPRSPSGQVTIDIQFTNTGGGNASNVFVDQLLFRTLAGSGAVTLASPLPMAFGNLAPGEVKTVSVILNMPAGVTRFSVTENGSLSDADGLGYRFSIAQAVIR
jgi:predicted extracellular nuclease